MITIAAFASIRAFQDSTFPEQPSDDRTILYVIGAIIAGLIIWYILSALLSKQDDDVVDGYDSTSNWESLLDIDQSDTNLSDKTHLEDLEEIVGYYAPGRKKFAKELKERQKRTKPKIGLAKGD